MHQDEGEPIRGFAARVKGQADVCNFVIDCPSCSNSVNYTSKVLKDIIVKGILDPEIQLDLLSESNQEMQLEDMLRYVEAKESGKHSAIKLSQSIQAASTVRSQYRKAKTFVPSTDIKCSYCGKPGHGRNAPLKVRKNQCPAFGKTCSHCGIPNHVVELCRTRTQTQKPRVNKSSSIENESQVVNECSIWQELCCVESKQATNISCATVGHHVFKDTNNS